MLLLWCKKNFIFWGSTQSTWWVIDRWLTHNNILSFFFNFAKLKIFLCFSGLTHWGLAIVFIFRQRLSMSLQLTFATSQPTKITRFNFQLIQSLCYPRYQPFISPLKWYAVFFLLKRAMAVWQKNILRLPQRNEIGIGKVVCLLGLHSFMVSLSLWAQTVLACATSAWWKWEIKNLFIITGTGTNSKIWYYISNLFW